ncbi:MAG: YetF domain-containing protein [Daejeonella sp.]
MQEYLEIVIRSSSIYIFMVLAIRFFGKKELAQLSTTDLVFIILISNAVQNAMVGPNTSLTGGVIAASVLFILNYFLKMLMFKSKTAKDLIESEAVLLIRNGHVNVRNMHRNQISMDELEEAVREHGIETYKDVKLALFEVDGNISVISGDLKALRQTQYKHRRKHKTLTRAS